MVNADNMRYDEGNGIPVLPAISELVSPACSRVKMFRIDITFIKNFINIKPIRENDFSDSYQIMITIIIN